MLKKEKLGSQFRRAEGDPRNSLLWEHDVGRFLFMKASDILLRAHEFKESHNSTWIIFFISGCIQVTML